MITRSQVAKGTKIMPVRRSVRIMRMQRLLAKKKEAKEEHQVRVQARRKRRVQKKNTTNEGEATGSGSTPTTQGQVQTGPRVKVSHPARSGYSVMISTCTSAHSSGTIGPLGQTSSRGRSVSSFISQTGRFSQSGTDVSNSNYLGPSNDAGSSGILNVNNGDLCDCLQRECPGCFSPCPTCSSPKCGTICRVNREWIFEDYA
ncbi:uncharacterized protein LOC103094578 [Monodelphis domestica]|uniref:uncharacterized protein LOC103094578 n=1 Tax=Monodelphis domestica TaxID=13616 RepID=UPI0004435A12|nr:uncharacterized protein LOC103094578 [Monodelphis domestica]XP_007506213.1 uncharacterized protein LOC103094578 [Monodelphis domestica]XP_007506214.1 uncharacterized protein LOC103094578 [Monodelphis domestica]XP_056665741.1 uncharacterized protein LOC103094578 [Monodelphis domestica]